MPGGYYIADDEGEDKWIVRLAPQCLTDILVQVATAADKETLFQFGIGKLLREEVEWNGDWQGMMQIEDWEEANFARWADQLEAYALIIRSALRSRRLPKHDEKPKEE